MYREGINNNLKLVDWFWQKLAIQGKIVDNSGFIIRKETEKAILCKAYVTENGEEDLVDIWFPKSCIETWEEWTERGEKQLASYEALVRFAKDHGVKGARKGLKTSTLKQMIADAGLVYNC